MSVRTPYYAITLEGEDITRWVSTVSIEEDDRQADSVSISIPDPQMIYADALFEGSTVEVDMGYAAEGQHALMLRALVTKVEMNYPTDGVPSVSLKGEDLSIKMGLEEKKARWRDRTVTDIVKAVAAKHGFTRDRIHAELNPDPMIQRKPISQDSKTDLAFLQELAQDYHAKCFVELNKSDQEVLYFIPEQRVLESRQSDRLILRYRMGPQSNLISFSPSFDSNYIDRLKKTDDIDHQGNDIKSREKPLPPVILWELDERRLAEASSADVPLIRALFAKGRKEKEKFTETLTIRRPTVGVVEPDESEMEARNDIFPSLRLGMSASGSTFGNIWLRAKSIVIIEGVSTRFNGAWYVHNVTHKIDSRGYQTDFRCVR